MEPFEPNADSGLPVLAQGVFWPLRGIGLKISIVHFQTQIDARSTCAANLCLSSDNKTLIKIFVLLAHTWWGHCAAPLENIVKAVGYKSCMLGAQSFFARPNEGNLSVAELLCRGAPIKRIPFEFL